MGRPRVKPVFEIEITKQSMENVLDDESGQIKAQMVRTTVYQQAVEKIDLPAVINAINSKNDKQ